MRRANLIVAEVLQELKAKIAPGVTTLDLDKLAEELTLKEKRNSCLSKVIPSQVGSFLAAYVHR